LASREHCRREGFFDERSQSQTDRTVISASVALKQASLDKRQRLVHRNLNRDDAQPAAAPATEVARSLSDCPWRRCSSRDH
jgi:hypothetical protein